ncbi:MAG TPA: PucR family transcriptional regulator ligand-binding domain-containing protein [Streptosporangiaceae bacterium]|nr:PucR family transcriptional regulator ligand-binding domain-containing protein [Streptosporangiaceae bacterium]
MPTVAEVLRLDVVQRGLPRVLAAADQLDRPVRWVHVIELPDAARLLHGGELVLSTGIALPDEAPLLDAYVSGLAGVGASALAVELGRKFTGGLPAGFVAAAEAHGLPLIVFQHEVPFVEITEAVHALIISDQLDQLRASARLHEVFTDLAVAGAGPGEILRQASLLAGRPLLLEDLSHHVLACEPAGADPAQLLASFEARSRALPPSPRTAYDQSSGWLVTTVGARGEDWGRVILVCDGPPGPVDTVLVERAATTLALGRLLARQQESLERQAHRTLISAILAGPGGDPDEISAQARALGVPVTGRQLVTAVLRSRDRGAGLLAQARVLDMAEAVAEACRADRIPALVGSLDDVRAGAVLSVPGTADPQQVLGRVCEAVRRGLARRASRPYGVPGDDPVIGAGAPASGVPDVRRSLLEARQVADAAAEGPRGTDGRPFYRLADLRLRGLLFLLGGDPRLATFVDRELGPLLRYDAAHGTALAGVLGAYLAAGGSKAGAAARAHVARPTLYGRLRHIERILGVDLDSAESRASLHVALLAHDAGYGPARPPGG